MTGRGEVDGATRTERSRRVAVDAVVRLAVLAGQVLLVSLFVAFATELDAYFALFGPELRGAMVAYVLAPLALAGAHIVATVRWLAGHALLFGSLNFLVALALSGLVLTPLRLPALVALAAVVAPWAAAYVALAPRLRALRARVRVEDYGELATGARRER